MSYCGQQRRDQGCYVMLSARCKGEGKFWVRCNVSYLTACVRACTTMMAARIYAAAWSERGEKVKLDETKLAAFSGFSKQTAHVSHAEETAVV